MRTCRRCGACFNEKDIEESNPFQSLGTMFHEDNREMDSQDLCQKCREDLGIFFLLAFDA